MASSYADKERKVKLAIAVVLVFFMLYLVGIILWNYVVAIFLAFFAAYFLKPVYTFLREHKLGRTPSGLITMLIGAIVIGIPVAVIFSLIINEALAIFSTENTAQYTQMLAANIAAIQNAFPQIDIPGSITKEITNSFTQILTYFESLILNSVQGIGDFVLQFLVFIFVFYYFLVEKEKISVACKKLFPFNKKNSDRLIFEFERITYSVLVTTGLLGLIQAVPLTIVFLYFNIPGAFLLGFLALLATFIPFVGIPLVWIPVVIFKLLQGETDVAIIIAILGIIISLLENARPLMQNKFGDLHPLVSLLGVVIGITYFGIVGVLIGPLLLSYTLLTARMFIEEYV